MCGIMYKIKKIKIFKSLIIFLLSFILFKLINESYIINIYNAYELIFISILSSSVIINTLFIEDSNKYMYIIEYSLLLIFILFFRKTNKNINVSDTEYIYKWIKNIFNNSVIFTNIIGNIVLFIPMGIIIGKSKIKNIFKLLIIVTLFPLIEIIQYILKIGVFDIYDILLYYIGFILGVIYIKGGRYYEKRQER